MGNRKIRSNWSYRSNNDLHCHPKSSFCSVDERNFIEIKKNTMNVCFLTCLESMMLIKEIWFHASLITPTCYSSFCKKETTKPKDKPALFRTKSSFLFPGWRYLPESITNSHTCTRHRLWLEYSVQGQTACWGFGRSYPDEIESSLIDTLAKVENILDCHKLWAQIHTRSQRTSNVFLFCTCHNKLDTISFSTLICFIHSLSICDKISAI